MTEQTTFYCIFRSGRSLAHKRGKPPAELEDLLTTWDGDYLEKDCVRAYQSPEDLARGSDLFDVSQEPPSDYEVVSFKGELVKSEGDDQNPGAVIAEFFRENRRWPVTAWLAEMAETSKSDPDVAKHIQTVQAGYKASALLADYEAKEKALKK